VKTTRRRLKARFGSDIREMNTRRCIGSRPSVVFEQDIVAEEAGDIEIGPSVIIKITSCHAANKCLDAGACGNGTFTEMAPAIVDKKLTKMRTAALFR